MCDRDFPSAPRLGVGAVITKNKKILLVKRKNEPQKGEWAIPGGMVKLGETLKKAAEREVLEETGLTIKASEPLYVFDLIEHSPGGKVLFHFVIVDLKADYIQGEIHPSDDAADARWFSSAELKSLKITQTTEKLVKIIGFSDFLLIDFCF